MKCSACSRSIRKPALTLHGMAFGPVCARKVLAEAGQIVERRGARLAAGEQTAVHRDPLTKDLFEGVST